MPDGFQFDAHTVRRLFDALAWVERQGAGARPQGQGRPVPIGTLRRFGVTCADPNTGVYPKPADKPNTYWFKYTVETHDLAQGNQTRDETWLDDFPPPDATYPDGYWLAHNYTDDSPATACYVPEGTLILCSWHNERWWFQYQREEFWGRVTGATSVGTGRWKYDFTEVYKSAAGYGGWTNLIGGRSGYLYNSVEEVGDATAVQIPTSAVVEVHVEYYNEAGTVTLEYWCQYEEFDQDASDGGSDGSGGSGGGGGGYIDVVVCGGWNRCGQYIVLPQKRIAYDGRGNITGITTIANDVIPIYQCESEGEPPSGGGDPSYGSGDPSDFSGPSWSDEPPLGDWYIWHNGAAGDGEWWISKTVGDTSDSYCWRKFDAGDTTPNVEGQYGTGPFTSGLATVGDAGGMDLNVSGTLNPDATGYYTFQGWDHLYNGLATWKRTGGLP